MMTTFVFVGRITREKGIDTILQAADRLVSKGYTQFRVVFVGDGPSLHDIIIHPLYETHLFSYGRLPKEQAMAVIASSQFLLMPSLLLETFGLSALDGLAQGVPVIGEKKGGLIPFILDTCCTITKEHPLDVCLQEALDMSPETYTTLCQKAKKLADCYTSTVRLDRFGQLSKNCKKCLLISDYIADIGGIESYLGQASSLLTRAGYKVDCFGKTARTHGRWRKLDLLVAGANGLASWLFTHKLHTTPQYDLLWFHSIQRWLGWTVLASVPRKKYPHRWIMYHDFGLMHPFPSRVYALEDLDRAKSFWGYMREGKKALSRRSWWSGGWLLVGAKYLFTLWLCRRCTRVGTVHLVPSDFLLPYLQHRLGSQARLVVFPHFSSHLRDV